MRTYLGVGAVIGMMVAAQAGTLRGEPEKETETDRIARLIKQLGDDDFAKREAASRELDAIGEPALTALRKAAESSDEPEIRLRAERVLRAISQRAAKKELAKWQGDWVSHNSKLSLKGDALSIEGGGECKLVIVKLGEKYASVDLHFLAGPYKGQVAQCILRLEGDTMHYCGSFTRPRPSEFLKDKTDPLKDNPLYSEWKRVKK